jgi:Uma2 family endonuclease
MRGGSIVTDVTELTEKHEPLHRLSVDQYHRMFEAGIITEDDKVELLDGVIIEMAAEGEPHVVALSLLTRWLNRGLEDERRLVRIGAPITLPPFSEPQPDIAVADFADSLGAHPEQAHLVIEVSFSSLRKDRGRKARIYAEAGLPQYWIVDLVHHTVIVHLSPSDTGYREMKTYAPPEVIDPELFGIPPLDLQALFKHL